MTRTPPYALAAALLLGACVPRTAPAPAPAAEPVGGGLPPVPARTGALALDVVYPGEGASLTAADSNFIFGSVGTGDAALRIDGVPVQVAPNGAFLGFVPVPRGGVYELVATRSGETRTLRRTVRVPAQRAERTPVSPFEPQDVSRVPGPAAAAAPAPDTALRAGVIRTRRPDGAIGTGAPGPGNPYEWFFPAGTRVALAETRGGARRVRLTADRSVWVDTAEVQLLPAGAPLPRGSVGAVRFTPARDWVELRIATSDRLPFRVEETEDGFTVSVFGATGRTNWLYYGPRDPLVEFAEWEQAADDVYRLHVRLSQRPWGFLQRWDERGNLVVRLRRPPSIDPAQPLRGLYLGVDAGHPPGGAIGPTRLTEAEANLAIARRLVALLRERGARVLETRPDTAAVGLGDRPVEATDSSVHLLVSVHNNAFPDGVNPFENNGTSVFYNQQHSLELAGHLQRELVRELGLRDLGVARADLALVRPTWMPSALTESMFLMLPEQEAALRDPAVQERIARAHLRGIEAFLRERAAGQGDRPSP
ncbi:MAG TPA: N-acetylmuramoyl-L-alanine amidase [Longimicrobiaceae bacterium]|jgi:N-acetylmuramoyl-L-alanine amidase